MQGSKRSFFHLIYAFIAMGGAAGSYGQQNTWPVIRPLHTHMLVNTGKDIPFVSLIKDSRGRSVYKFECHNGNYEDESEINFSGDFQCALFAISGSTPASGNLLAANNQNEQSTDWWNRGRVRSAQFRGECSAYPEYSTNRHFKLRGMLITLQFNNIEWSERKDESNNPAVRQFTVILDVTPDKTATSPSAELPAGAAPPGSCYP